MSKLEYRSSPSGVRAAAARLGEFSAQRFDSLCTAAGFGPYSVEAARILRSLIAPWADEPEGQPLGWVSEISDDNTPIEFSVAIQPGRTEVRALFEPQGTEATLDAFREAGLAFNRRIEREFGASLERFRRVQELFLPVNMTGPFAVWSSVVFSPGHDPLFKAYFNPQAAGVSNAYDLLREGLRRVGLEDAWPALGPVLRRGPELDEVKYFALDLTATPDARVKVYVRHHAISPAELELASSAAESYVPGEALEFVKEMRGSDERLDARAPFTCSAFFGGRSPKPGATTVYVPVCAYARDDAAVYDRVRGFMQVRGVDSSGYDAIIRGFANRPLASGVGMQSWVALRRHAGIRLTVYLATEARRVHAPGTVPAPTPSRAALVAAGTRR